MAFLYCLKKIKATLNRLLVLTYDFNLEKATNRLLYIKHK